MAVTSAPWSSNCRTTQPPRNPVAPVTSIFLPCQKLTSLTPLYGGIGIYLALLVGAKQRPYICFMANQNGPVLDMTPDGAFIEPTKPSYFTILARLAAFAVLLLVAAVTFWMALFIVPVLIILGIAGYALARTQVRRF